MKKRIILFLFLLSCSVCWPANTVVILLWYDGHIASANPAAMQSWGDDLPDGTGARLAANGDVSLPWAVAIANNYDGSGTDVDVFVAGGDNVDFSAIGAARNASFAELVDRIDGTVGDALTSAGGKLYPLLGHHDLGGGAPYGDDDYQAFFHNDGMGTIIPALGAGAGQIDNQWWPTAVTDDTPCAYTVSKNGFRLVFLCAIMLEIGLDTAGQTDTFGGDADAKTQIQWLEQMLDEAQAANEPVIIFTHQPILSNDVGAVAQLKISGWADAVTLFATGNGGVPYTIPIMVVAGHAHRDQSIITDAGVVYINVGGDVWGKSLTDTTRFSHAVLEVTAPTYNTPDGNMGLITLTGYGYQRSWSMNKVLAAHWKLNEPSGTTIVDSTGNGYTGTADSAVTSVSAPLGHGITFVGGTPDFIEVATAPSVDLPLSMSVWVRFSDTAASAYIIGQFDASGGAGDARSVALEIFNNSPRMVTKPAALVHTNPNAGVTIVDGIWHLIVGVWTSATLRDIYVDGVFKATDSTDKGFSALIDSATIGRRGGGDDDKPFTGDLSDMRIYSGALSANDVATLYRAGTTGLRDRHSTRKKIGIRGRRRY